MMLTGPAPLWATAVAPKGTATHNPGVWEPSAAKFGEFVGYVTKLQAEKHIDSFEPVLMRPHGGDLNGFFLIRGDAGKLATLRQSDHWKDWEAWGGYHMQGFGVIECALADGVGDFMARFAKQIS